MTSNIDDPLPQALDWLDAGHKVALATVIETWGSAPRPVGSHLVICDDGRLEGSVSGGCVEGDVLVNAEEIMAEGGFRRLEYGVADETAWTVGLPCGGTIRVIVQEVAEQGFPPALLRQVVEARARRRSLPVATDLETGRSTADEAVPDASERSFTQVYAPQPRLVIVGAGHIGQALAPMALLAGFDVTVIDPRERFATAARFAGVRLDHRFPDEALATMPLDPASALVALSHDPKIDDPALIAALGSPAFHIAALGSRRNQGRRLERLAAAGWDAAALARIHGPAGLKIGALTPAEIAISILAELIAARRGAL